MSYEFYITPEQYDIALKNGISNSRLYQRINVQGWTMERAITEPPKQMKKIPETIRKRANANGIPYDTLLKRIRVYGWDEQRACTEPLQDFKKQAAKAREARKKYPQEILDLLNQNGIKYCTFQARVTKLKWDMYTAATTLTITKEEAGRRGKTARQASRLLLGG